MSPHCLFAPSYGARTEVTSPQHQSCVAPTSKLCRLTRTTIHYITINVLRKVRKFHRSINVEDRLTLKDFLRENARMK